MSEPFWVPLGGAGVDYKGDWAAGTQYQSGDVVRYNGVDYLAVNPSLGTTPPGTLGSYPLPGTELYFEQRTSDLALANYIFNGQAIVYDGSPIVIAMNVAQLVAGAANTLARFYVYDGTTQIYQIGHTEIGASGQMDGMSCWNRLVPTPGSHTYRIYAAHSGGTTCTVKAGGTLSPAQMRILKA